MYWLSKEEHDKIRDPFIQSFESLDSPEVYSRDLDDFQLAGIVKVVREYARILPDATALSIPGGFRPENLETRPTSSTCVCV